MTVMLKLSEDLEVPLSLATSKLAIIAESGAGKSYTATKLAELLLDVGVQIIALDPIGIWWGLRSSADGKRAGYPILVMGGDHGDLPLTPGSGAMVARMLAESGVSAVIDLSNFITSEVKRFSADFAEGFYQAKKKHRSPVHLFLEEGQTFAPQTPERDENVMLNRFERLCKQLRNCGVGWSMITQAPQSVHKRILNLAPTLILLRTSGSHERKAIAEWAKSNATGGTDLIGDLPTLETGTAYVWSPSFLKISELVKIAKKTTFDAGKTPEVGETAIEPRKLAPVDLEKFRAAMAETVKAAEADDPKALKRTIAELRGQIAAAIKAKPGPAPKPVKQPRRVDVPVIGLAVLKRLEAAVELSNVAATQLGKAIGEFVRTLADARREFGSGPTLGSLLKTIPANCQVAKGPEIRNVSRVVYTEAVEAKSHRLATKTAARELAADIQADLDHDLSKGQRTTLTAIAQYPDGVDKVQLSVLAGYKRSTRDLMVQQLVRAGFVVKRGTMLEATEAGRAVLGDFEQLPTGDALREHWLARLDTGERRVLEVLVGEHPASVRPNDLDDRVGYKRSTRDLMLQRLARRKLIVKTSDGVRASDLLFGAA